MAHLRQPETIDSAIRRMGVKGLREGEVVWQCDSEMVIGRLYKVVLRVQTAHLDNFKTGLDEAISRSASGIQISTSVEVVIESDADAFSFVRRTSAKNIVLDREYKEWAWDVRPKHTGSYPVNVRIVSTTKLDGAEIPFDAFTDGRTVSVHWDWWYFLTNATNTQSPIWFSGLVVGGWLLCWKWLGSLVKFGRSRWTKTPTPPDPKSDL